MPIQAQSADGVIHEFPDDTSRDVIDRVMKNYAQETGAGGTGTAFRSGVLEGIPILGPALHGGAERLAAGLRSITPGGKSYGEELERLQRYEERTAKAHPLAETAGEVTGGVTGGVAETAMAGLSPATRWVMGLGAKTVPGTIAAQGLSGAAINAADALARGQDPRLAAALGGGLGAGGAALAPVVSRLAEPVTRLIRGAQEPGLEAERRVAGTLDKALEGAPSERPYPGLTPEEFRAEAAKGTPVGLIDIGGEPARALARSAANVSPEARATLDRFINDRYETQAARFTDWFNQTFHYPDAVAQHEAIDQASREVNRPAYQRAYEAGDREIWSPELERLTAAPYVKSALNRAISKWKNFAVRDGYGALNPPFRVERGGLIVREGSGQPAYPNIQLWDYAARDLQDRARAAPQGSQQRLIFNDLARLVKNELDRIVPEYRGARSGAARFFGAENALEAGQQAVRSRMSNRELRANLARLRPQERQLFQDGFVSRFVDDLRQTGDRRNVLNQIGRSPAARERLNMVLGPERARELESMVRVEGIMDLARGAVQGNSRTAQYLVELGLAGGEYYAESGFTYDPKAMMHAALTFGLAHGVGGAARAAQRKIDERVVNKVAELLTSNDVSAIDRGIKMLSSNPTLLGAVRNFDAALLGAAGRGVGAVAARTHERPSVTVPRRPAGGSDLSALSKSEPPPLQ